MDLRSKEILGLDVARLNSVQFALAPRTMALLSWAPSHLCHSERRLPQRRIPVSSICVRQTPQNGIDIVISNPRQIRARVAHGLLPPKQES